MDFFLSFLHSFSINSVKSQFINMGKLCENRCSGSCSMTHRILTHPKGADGSSGEWKLNVERWVMVGRTEVRHLQGGWAMDGKHF